PGPAQPPATPARGAAHVFARLVVALRWWVIGFWAVATAASLLVFPSFSEAGGSGGLKGILSSDTPAVETEKRSAELFGYPLIARTVVVQRDPDGLSPYAQARTVVRAVAVDRGRAGDVRPVLGALPLTNTAGLFPGSAEKSTTSLTYLLFAPETSLGARTRAARSYAREFFTEEDDVVGVTGSAPARSAQGRIIKVSLPHVELATLVAIVLIVGFAFRSVVAPAVTVLTAGVAYVATLRLSGAVAQLFDLPSPEELEPVVVALLLGVVTDYVVFFCAGLQEVPDRSDTRAATVTAIARSTPIVAVAGLAVAAGTATLLVAKSPFFRALGPALAFTVLVGLLVAVTLVPALLAVLGDWIFWPRRPRRAAHRRSSRLLGALDGLLARVERRQWPRSLVTALALRRRLAVVVLVVCAGGLLLAAVPIARLQLGVSFVSALPQEAPVRAAAASAQAGFSPGILSPTVVLLEGDGVGRSSRELARLGDLIAEEPGIAGVLGPGSQPLPSRFGVLVARSGDAARYLVVLDDDPLSARAVETVDRLQDAMPVLMAQSGLSGVRVALAGDSATASFLVHQTERDLLRIALTAMAANLLMLLIFLRALVASVVLLVCSLLALSATVGITTLLFAWLDPGQGLTFYVPFATAVLLLAFGSDYNIFTVGHVWEAARSGSFRESLTSSLPVAIRAVTVAGLALAASFGLLVLVPLLPFRQLAFAMSLGILVDVLVVRTLLMPALLGLLGTSSAWPSRRLREDPTSRPVGPDGRQVEVAEVPEGTGA
ncbi:MAG: MMPL family transporter, partial [Nocardioidaceae bacterium]